ncbi:hypothetical protein HN51_027991, partial [Arachis hypogaea]
SGRRRHHWSVFHLSSCAANRFDSCVVVRFSACPRRCHQHLCHPHLYSPLCSPLRPRLCSPLCPDSAHPLSSFAALFTTTLFLSWSRQFADFLPCLDIDDLKDKLDDGMFLLNVGVDYGSIKEVAEILMDMHEECLEGNFVTIERYRQAIVNQAAHPRAVPQIVNDKDDDEDEEDDDVQGGQNGESSARQATSNMDVDIPKSESNMSSGNMRIDDEPLKKDAGEAEDGWVVVSKKKKTRLEKIR